MIFHLLIKKKKTTNIFRGLSWPKETYERLELYARRSAIKSWPPNIKKTLNTCVF